jgi:hypothetical protein
MTFQPKPLFGADQPKPSEPDKATMPSSDGAMGNLSIRLPESQRDKLRRIQPWPMSLGATVRWLIEQWNE